MFEATAEIKRVGESRLIGHFGDGDGFVLEQFLGSHHSFFPYVFVGRGAGDLAYPAIELRPTEIHRPGQFIDREVGSGQQTLNLEIEYFQELTVALAGEEGKAIRPPCPFPSEARRPVAFPVGGDLEGEWEGR